MQNMQKLLEIMALLRDPQKGCPWDIEQDFASIVPCTLEEAYEVADAIEKNDMALLKEELGDLLLQVVFHSQMAAEAGHFAFEDVAGAIADKLVVRHPHVFGDATIKTSEAQTEAWEKQKEEERRAKQEGEPSLLDGVTKGLPALVRAEKLQKRAARGGFDWPSVAPVLDKLKEETAELEAEISANASTERCAEELGDLLFVCVNLARHLRIDAETCLRQANAKFERRFRYIEDSLRRQGKDIRKTTLEELDKLWDKAKKEAA